MSWRESSCFLTKKPSKSSDFYYLEPGLYTSITDFVEAMNTLIQRRHNHNENCITITVSRRAPKVAIDLANETSGFAFFSMDLEQIFESDVGNEFSVMLKVKGHQKPKIALVYCLHTASHDIN